MDLATIGVIAKIGEALGKLVSHPVKERAQIVAAVVEPTMKDMTAVHKDYLKMFKAVERDLAAVPDSGPARQAVQKAREFLSDARVELVAERRKLAHLSE